MMTRFVGGALAAACVLALTMAFVMPAGEAMAFSEPIPTKISLFKWGGNPKVGKLYKIVSKGAFPLPAVGTGPDVNGGSLLVTVGAGEVTCDLSNTANWKGLGNPAGSTGYKYVNKSAPTGDLCKVVIVKEKVIKVLAKGVGSVALPGDVGTNPDVSMELNVGLDSYCAEAIGPHFKEKAETLIKMKDQAAPASCAKCGDNSVNLPGEECDGTDDSACPGRCVPPGSGGGTCGDNTVNGGGECTCAPEECDGTSDALCPGICQPNCRCPEPLCGNGVLEAGEDCEPPCSEDAPCGGGTICGKDCTCVPNVPCDCGTPDPSLFDFMNVTGTGVCGEVRDGADLKLTDLDCAKSYLGGGILGSFATNGTGIPLGKNIHKVECCYDTTLILGATTEAETGDFKTCTSAGCAFGGPVPTITTPSIISVCSVNTLEFDSFGHMDCSTGEGFISIPMSSDVFLIGDGMPRRCSPDTTGDAAGFVCTDDSQCPDGTCLYDWADHCDSNSPNPGAFCTSDAQCAPGTCLDVSYIQPCAVCNPVTSVCNGGPDQGSACEPQTPDLGPAYPNSQDCHAPPGLFISTTHMPNPLGTSTVGLQADDGIFCGYCRDVAVEGSFCFEGDPDEWPSPGQSGCPDSVANPNCQPSMRCIGGANAGDSCTLATQVADCDSDVCGHGDISGCGPLVTPRCHSDADCYAPYESCVQRDLGAFDQAGGRSFSMTGHGAGPLTDGLQHEALIAAAFCTPPTYSDADPNASLPGPGASSYPAMFRLTYSTSGAFLEVTGGIID